ncbi:Lrp/AsnC family transcriptional regulator [Clostridium luticellarii]|jgi:Lrp/AsnC family leucine-responsive transcriptional regulator|uniref:Leucine-responsive regulatory protein n=1 Tax=Clostridium luticellarii TaxID=1691940 RepID=A0A2T0BSR0_9CLOT|nr:Lrp/AsnC family transcriptional regulator [Clostridium luticellarii]MCI1945647.1 Lrp/AsnC family transcriptional regulator [Clostridium luticellarii]MCI1968464.1 Lrp/AsnC family transcriptional regulator [Clostridium luticellarii]MCI1996519.1 Lrp/AsnC family transcriptional regulator [Clostridium luticellarii]MCI2039858.1 Lrp/AsnC family transcriptional regulator [Clostridium luticellarii]PRR86855.1 Leucine-responsive regulatory protein [Clostridium luticellarii]
MDNIDIRILKLLQKNARISISEISNIINLSIPAVSDRLKKLYNSGVIKKYTIIVNNKKFNKNLTSILFVSLKDPVFTDKFIKIIENEDEIVEYSYLVGDFDFMLKVVTRDTETLQKILHRIKYIDGIERVKAIIVLSTVKKVNLTLPDKVK